MAPVMDATRRGMVTMSASLQMLAHTALSIANIRAQLDWMRELTNQLAGWMKNKFARYGLVLQAGLPMALLSTATVRDLVIHRADLVLLFRSLHDQILCTLSGGFVDAGLTLQDNAVVAEEGETILF